MPSVTIDRFKKVLSGGKEISDKLVTARVAKVNAALHEVDTELGRIGKNGLRFTGADGIISARPSPLPVAAARDAAMNHADDAAKYAALEQVKADAKALAKVTRKRVDKLGKLINAARASMANKPNGPEAEVASILGAGDGTFLTELHNVFVSSQAEGTGMMGLKSAEAVAVHKYTQGDYKPMNAHLRGEFNDQNDPGGNKRARAEILIKHCTAGLGRLPNYQGTTKRGDPGFNGIEELYRLDDVFTLNMLYSTGIGFSFGGKWRITVQGKTGKFVKMLSNRPSEQEVVFLPGTRFLVTSRGQKDGNEFVTITEL